MPRTEYPTNKGPLGIALAKTAIVAFPWYQSLIKGFITPATLTWTIIVVLGGLIWNLITTGQLVAEIAGPVGIYSLTNQAAQLGFIYVLQLTAIISIHLAIINVLPFPALDGGRLLFLGIEKIKGSPISFKVERIANAIGFVILIILMIAITWRDVVRFF